MDAFRLHAILVRECLVTDEPFVVLDSVQLMHLDNAADCITEEATVDGAEALDKVQALEAELKTTRLKLREAREGKQTAERALARHQAQLAIPFAELAFKES